ncbi:MAG: hypothetical protein HY688_03725 [Chloroflexi bacterium]|nr:hypothetical protein [Chloroflexota bacterium]
MYYVLLYDYVEDIVAKRQPFRQQHLEMLRDLHAAGQLVMAGAWGDPVDGAALLFRVDDTRPIETFVRSDPYVAHGLVTRWRIRRWDVVIGG